MKLFKAITYVMISLLLVVTACKKEEDTKRDTTELQQSFQTILNNAVDKDTFIYNGVLLVDIPELDLHWKGAAGKASPTANMQPDVQFRSASIGKTFFTALTLRLVEEGKLSLDDKLSKYLPVSIMKNLMIYNGKDYSNEITIRQCLTHTSGIGDYFFENPDANGFPQFVTLILTEPTRFWTPEETIEYAKQNVPPHFEPGKGFFYSDTGYNLVGLALEKIMGKPLHDLYKEWVFNPLKLNNTYMEYRDQARGGVPSIGVSHSYFLDLDITDAVSLSADWAGGGLITNAEDLFAFINALDKGTFFKRSSSFATMQQEFIEGYGMGLVMQRLGADGLLIGHDGAYNSFMFKWKDITITGTLNQFEAANGKFTEQIILPVIEKIKAFN